MLSRPAVLRFNAPWLLVMALLTALQIHLWFGPDIWNHVYLGRLILEQRTANPVDSVFLSPAPFTINSIWLFQVICQVLYTVGGPALVTIAVGLAWLGIFWLWLEIARPERRPWIGLPLTLFFILVCSVRYEERPEVVSALCFLWMLRRLQSLDVPTVRDFALFALVEILWTNFHSYFPLGVALAGAWWLTRARHRAKGMALVVMVAAATSLSPYGWRVWWAVSRLWGSLPVLAQSIQELAPPYGEIYRLAPIRAYWIAWGATLWALFRTALGAAKVRRFPSEVRFAALLGLVGLGLSLLSVRNFLFLFLFSGPIWRLEIERWAGPLPAAMARWERRSAWAWSAVCVALIVSVVTDAFYERVSIAKRFGLGATNYNYPLRFVDWAKRNGIRGLVFNQPADGSLLAFLTPGIRPYGDSRFCLEIPVEEYFQAWQEPKNFFALHGRRDFDGALIDTRYHALLAALLGNPAWRLVYADLARAFFVPTQKFAHLTEFTGSPYEGEDPSLLAHGELIHAWTAAFVDSADTTRLATWLESLKKVRPIPWTVVREALVYLIPRADERLLKRTLALALNIDPGEEAGLAEIQELLEKIPPDIRHAGFTAQRDSSPL